MQVQNFNTVFFLCYNLTALFFYNKFMDTNLQTLAETAKKNFSLWNETLQTKDAQKVADLYTDDCTFLPTMSGELKRGKTGAKEYFTHFLEKDPFGEIKQDAVQAIGDKCYLHSGLYNFIVGPADNRQTVEARFTYVWQLNDQNKWEISHHHSSVKPQ
jgi:uncharacterized protein (TIGR02246 family)